MRARVSWSGVVTSTMDRQPYWRARRPAASASPWVVSGSGWKQITRGAWLRGRHRLGGTSRPSEMASTGARSRAASSRPFPSRSPGPPSTTMASTRAGMPWAGQTNRRPVTAAKITTRTITAPASRRQRRRRVTGLLARGVEVLPATGTNLRRGSGQRVHRRRERRGAPVPGRHGGHGQGPVAGQRWGREGDRHVFGGIMGPNDAVGNVGRIGERLESVRAAGRYVERPLLVV